MGSTHGSSSHERPSDQGTFNLTVSSEPTVYVVERDDKCRRQLREWLVDDGFHVVEFDDVEQFLASSWSVEAACVLVDVSSPDADGPETHQRLREERVRVPILFLIGPAEREIARESFRRGCDFIAKPIGQASLRARVPRALEIQEDKRIERERRNTVQQRVDSLSAREFDVMMALVDRYSYAERARQMGLNASAAASHALRVLDKMMVSSDTELVRLLRSVGMPSPRQKTG